MTDVLQPCPNCGGRAKLHAKGYKVYVECDGDCWTRTRSYFSIEDAAREWNRKTAKAFEPEYRRYTCPDCGHDWMEDCDATDYPNYCPSCGKALRRN